MSLTPPPPQESAELACKSKKLRAIQSTIKKSLIWPLKFRKLRQKHKKMLFHLFYIVLLQIINSDKQDSSGEKIVSIATIFSQQKVKNDI